MHPSLWFTLLALGSISFATPVDESTAPKIRSEGKLCSLPPPAIGEVPCNAIQEAPRALDGVSFITAAVAIDQREASPDERRSGFFRVIAPPVAERTAMPEPLEPLEIVGPAVTPEVNHKKKHAEEKPAVLQRYMAPQLAERTAAPEPISAAEFERRGRVGGIFQEAHNAVKAGKDIVDAAKNVVDPTTTTAPPLAPPTGEVTAPSTGEVMASPTGEVTAMTPAPSSNAARPLLPTFFPRGIAVLKSISVVGFEWRRSVFDTIIGAHLATKVGSEIAQDL